MVQDSFDNSANLKLTKSELTQKDEAPGALSALFQDAYQHPIKTGLEVTAAVALGGAAIYSASKGRLPGIFAGKPEVLLIEDTPGVANAFRDVLQTNGHKVTWVTGIKSLNPLTGFAPDGGEMALSKRFKLALLDGDLGKDRLTGPEIVGALRDRKIMTIGTSSVESFNTAIRANALGADGAPGAIAANKAVVFTSLLGNKLDMTAAIKSPAVAQAGLDTFQTTMRLPENEALRKAADAKFMYYMTAK